MAERDYQLARVEEAIRDGRYVFALAELWRLLPSAHEADDTATLERIADNARWLARNALRPDERDEGQRLLDELARLRPEPAAEPEPEGVTCACGGALAPGDRFCPACGTPVPSPRRLRRLEGAYANLRLVHLPIHASWLNQIELYFSIVQRKALTPNDLHSLDALGERLQRFGEHYRQIAQPFDWTFTRADLDRLLAKIETHEPNLTLAA